MQNFLISFLLFELCFVVGCTTLEHRVAGKTGCPVDGIEISDGSSDALSWVAPGQGLGYSSWKARCRGQSFICSARSNESLDDLSCAPMVASGVSSGEPEMKGARPEGFDNFIDGLNKKSTAQKKNQKEK